MAFTQAVTGNAIVPNDINQYYNFVTGAINTTAISTTATATAPQGRMAIFGGRYLAIACGTAGLQIVDVTDATNPIMFTPYVPVTSANCSAVTTVGRYLAVLSDSAGMLSIVDPSTPSSPTTLSNTSAGTFCHDVVSVGKMVLTVCGFAVKGFDCSNPAAPTLAWTYNAASNTGDCHILGVFNGRYVAVPHQQSNTIIVLNAFTGAVIGTLTGGSVVEPMAITAFGNYLAVCQKNPNNVLILDARNPASLSLVATVALGGIISYPSFISAWGRYLLTSNQNTAGTAAGTITVIDAKTPTTPSILTTLTVGSTPLGNAVLGRYLAVANGSFGNTSTNTLMVFDPSAADIGNARINGASAGTLWVEEDAFVTGGANVGALNVRAGGAIVDGDSAFTSHLAVGGNLQTSSETVAYAATVALTVTNADTHVFASITGALTINASSGGKAGQTLRLILPNDGTSGRVVTFGTNFKSAGTLTGTTSKTAVMSFTSDGQNWYESGRITGL